MDINTSSDLRPCPFCGNKEGLGMGITRVDSNYVYCQCNTKKVAHGWNARPIEDALQAENARLTAERDLLWKTLHAAYITCVEADMAGDLPEILDGKLLDEMNIALKGGE